MKFVTNSIHTGKSKSFADLVQEFQAKKMQKLASADAVVKTAGTDAKQEEGESSGQLDVEPLHQEGESTPKVKGKSGESSEKKPEASAAAPVKQAEGIVDKKNENNEPAEESGQTKADFPKLTNDPDAGKHRDGDGDQKKSEAKAVVETKEAGGIANFGDKKAKPFGAKEEGKKDSKDAKEGKEETKPAKDAKKASAKPSFVRVANLDSKSKAWLKKYWSDLYMPEYADAMVQDK